jgi:hypothetical protein
VCVWGGGGGEVQVMATMQVVVSPSARFTYTAPVRGCHLITDLVRAAAAKVGSGGVHNKGDKGAKGDGLEEEQGLYHVLLSHTSAGLCVTSSSPPELGEAMEACLNQVVLHSPCSPLALLLLSSCSSLDLLLLSSC